MAFTAENLEQRRPYLTTRFYDELKTRSVNGDPFTQTADDPPKAFRVGECRVVEPGKRTSFEVLLFWKTDTRSEQRPIRVEIEKTDGRWLVDSVANSNGR